jgi:hypothetical protein
MMHWRVCPKRHSESCKSIDGMRKTVQLIEMMCVLKISSSHILRYYYLKVMSNDRDLTDVRGIAKER